MLKLAYVIVFTSLLFIGGPASAQRKTIPQQLAQEGVDLKSGATVPSGTAPDMDVVLRQTDLIVVGIVGKPRSYLSDDQMTIFSDYPIVKPRVFFDTAVASSPKPGLPEIVVTLEGGKITIAGLTYTVTPEALPNLEPGSECLLLLKRNKGKLYIAGDGHLGAFQVSDQKLNPLTRVRNFAPQYVGAPASAATESIVKQRHSIVR